MDVRDIQDLGICSPRKFAVVFIEVQGSWVGSVRPST